MSDRLVALRKIHQRAASLSAIDRARVFFAGAPDVRELPELPRAFEGTPLPNCSSCNEKCCYAPHRVRLRLEDVARLMDAGLSWAIEESFDSKEPPILRQSAGSCVFLDADELCSIYADRPLSCRAFPYQVTEARDAVRYSGACNSRRIGSKEEADFQVSLAMAAYESRRLDVVCSTLASQEIDALGLRGPFGSADGTSEMRGLESWLEKGKPGTQ